MINKENEIRTYLKSLTIEDIANSVYLVGVNFEKAPIDEIMSRIISLLYEVNSLKSIIANFKDEPKVLSPIPRASLNPKDSQEYRRVITEEYYRKNNALIKIATNSYVYDELVRKMSEPVENDSMTL